MSNCNIFTSFGRGFLAGAGFGLGMGLCNIARSAMWSLNMQFPPLFGAFSFMPFNCCFGNNFYTYNTPMPEIKLPDFNSSIYNIPTFSQATPAYSNLNFMQMPVVPSVNFDTFTKSTNPKSETSDKTEKDTETPADYNENKGKKLAAALKSRQTGQTGYCARAVSDALEAVGLSNGRRGDAEVYADLLADNSNFKEVSLDNWQNAPDGAIFWYAPSSQGYSSEHGHVQGIVDGKGVSDHVEGTLRKPDKIFIPV